MKLPVIVASLVLASTAAYAQAPGDYDGDIAPPGMAPVVAAPVVVAPVKQQRWSIGLGIGGMELSPHNNPDVSAHFDVAQLYVRYRPWRHLELELGLGGGGESENPETGMNGNREISTAVLALRYRFSPQRRWNWWLMAGMGSLSVVNAGASDEERETAHQSTLQFGVGLERRFRRFALQLEIRAVGVAPQEQEDGGDYATPDVPLETMQPLPPIDEPRGRGGLKGGQFVFGGSWYF